MKPGGFAIARPDFPATNLTLRQFLQNLYLSKMSEFPELPKSSHKCQNCRDCQRIAGIAGIVENVHILADTLYALRNKYLNEHR